MGYPGRAAASFLAGVLLVTGCQGGDADAAAERGADPEAWEGDVEEVARLARHREGTEEDWMVHYLTVTEAWDRGWDTLPMGESMARIGATFVGTRYVPKTLELAGDEGVVVNLLELDCMTFVENVLALARFIRLADPGILDSELRTRELYMDLLREIRYRGGRVEGYPSRLHYFSDWIRDNEAKGLVREVTDRLGGVEDVRAIDFMSNHPEAYRQLANPVRLAAVEEIEEELSALTRYRIPEHDIPAWVGWIRNGDILAATSTVEGLDVAHTGLAYWQGEELHLLHAPLVGEAVEISDLPLATRILRIQGQDGIRVVRPLEP